VNTSINDAIDELIAETSSLLVVSSGVEANTASLVTINTSINDAIDELVTETSGLVTINTSINDAIDELIAETSSLLVVSSGVEANTNNILTHIARRALCDTADSAANTALTQTISGSTGYRHCLVAFSAAVSGAALSSTVTVSVMDGSTAFYKTVLGAGSPIGEIRSFNFDVPISITSDSDLVLYATAGGASAVITGNLVYITELC
jgi:hypothetical protein